MDTNPGIFNSVEEECRFWKERAKIYQNDWINVKQEYDDFIDLSKQMESEMDASLNQKEHKIKELSSRIVRLEDENVSFKQKVASQNTELINFRVKFEISQKEQESMKEQVRNLEQKNDDLERNQRTLSESINDMNDSLEKTYEKNALLEYELEEKEALQEKLQRLMDEIRDIKLEFNVQLKKTGSKHANDKVSPSNRCPRHRNWKVYALKPTFQNEEARRNGNTSISDVSRENVLGIVANMLKKLNTMEEGFEKYRDASSINERCNAMDDVESSKEH